MHLFWISRLYLQNESTKDQTYDNETHEVTK